MRRTNVTAIPHFICVYLRPSAAIFPPMLRRNVLIFHNAALGDFVMTWPVAMAMGRVLAQSRIVYVTSSQKGQLAERLISVEYNDVENGWHGLHQDDPSSLAETPAKLLKSMQMAIVFSQARDDRFIGNVQRIAGDAPVLHLSPNPPAGVHVWQHQLAQLESSPVLRSAVEQVQKVVADQGVVASPAKGKTVIIHPGSGAGRKNWPIDRFVEVAMMLKAKGREVIVTLGEVERDRLGSAADRLAGVAKLRHCETTHDLLDALGGASAYIGNDSGPTHLAAAMGKRVVALFGPTSDAASWRPMGPGVRVLSFDQSPADVVKAAL